MRGQDGGRGGGPGGHRFDGVAALLEHAGDDAQVGGVVVGGQDAQRAEGLERVEGLPLAVGPEQPIERLAQRPAQQRAGQPGRAGREHRRQRLPLGGRRQHEDGPRHRAQRGAGEAHGQHVEIGHAQVEDEQIGAAVGGEVIEAASRRVRDGDLEAGRAQLALGRETRGARRAQHDRTPAGERLRGCRRRCGVAGHERQRDPEPRAGAVHVVDADGAAHRLGQAAADGQPEAHAAVPPRRRGVALDERLEQLRRRPGPDADAGVLELDAHAAARRDRGAHQHAARVGERDRVRQQLADDEAHARGVADDQRRQRRIDQGREVQALLVGAPGVDLHGRVDERGEIEGGVRQRQRAAFEGGVVDRVLDDRQHRLAGGERRRDVLVLLRRQRRLEEQAGGAEDGVHRRLELVAHRREEGGPRPGRGLGLAPRVGELALEAGDHGVAHRVPPGERTETTAASSAMAVACSRPIADQRSTAARTMAAWIGFTR